MGRITTPAAKRRCAGHWLLVAPRPGTTSPWSSKATDIAQVCGLDAVRRIERGSAYSGSMLPRRWTRAELRAAGAALHDRMTETVLLREADFASLFAHGSPQALRTCCAGQRCAARGQCARWDWR